MQLVLDSGTVFTCVCYRFTCGLVYYALALNTGSLYGNIFINTFIAGAVDIPAFILCMFLMQWKLTGRRGTGCLGLAGAGVSSFICIPMIVYSEFLFTFVEAELRIRCST